MCVVVSIRSHEDAGDVWLTPRETSELVRLTVKTLANWRSLGIGPPYRKMSPGRGGRIRYQRSGVDAWLANDRAEAA